MRLREQNEHLSVHAIAGTEVVLLALDASEEAAIGLLGFTILKRKGETGKFFPLRSGGHTFGGLHSDEDPDEEASKDSRSLPIQAMMWSDYVVDNNTKYTYRVVPVYGTPTALKPNNNRAVEVTVTTEDPDEKTHGVYFNRGVAGSQAYSRKFGDSRRWYLVEHGTEGDEVSKPRRPRATEFIKPDDVPPEKGAKAWLSRGLEEAMLGFIEQARGPKYSLRAAVYEFTHKPAIQAFVDAIESGADIKIIHHAKRVNVLRLKQNYDADTTTSYTKKIDKNKEVPDTSKKPKLHKNREAIKEVEKDAVCKAADAAVSQVGLRKPESKKAAAKLLNAFDSMMIERTDTTISHNKFIVLLENGKPQQVWTGSTNFTGGGIYGQSNVGHVVRDPKVAKKYFDYWNKLSKDPKKKSAKNDAPTEGIKNFTVKQQPDLVGVPPKGITPVFSPRLNKGMLDWYAERLANAENSVFFTAAFSVANEIFDIVKDEKKVDDDEPYLRYLLLEGIGGLLKEKAPVIRKCAQNRVAWGDTMKNSDDDEHHQFIETLTGLNSHVNYLHTKYMLIDPLSDDPIVISGSANFSEASTVNNDENMLIIRGNTRIADIFLTEFMRLFNHFSVRNKLNAMSAEKRKKSRQLTPNNSWTKPYYDARKQECKQRLLFR